MSFATWLGFGEKRGGSYTDALIAAIQSNAGGATITVPDASGAVEAASGLVQRAFQASDLTGAPAHVAAALTPSVLGMIGRALIRRGEIVLHISVSPDGALVLCPSQTYDVSGDPDPSSWQYQVTLGGPSRTITHNHVPAAGVIHIRTGIDPERPWRGVGPMQAATLAGGLLAALQGALRDESASPRGSLLPIPKKGGDDPTVEALKGDIRTASGALLLVEGMEQSFGAGPAGVGQGWIPRRFGAAPPDALISLLENAGKDVLSACGVNPSLFAATSGTAAREAWRQALFGLVAPLGRIVSEEIAAKLDAPGFALDWQELRASDLSGRARAFQSMVTGGMDVSEAAGLAGLMVPSEG